MISQIAGGRIQAMPSPYLEWMDENLEMRRLVIVDRVFIGRICRGIDDTRRIIVKHPAVSRDHAEINMSGSQPLIRDLSKNGTWVNDVRLAAGSTKSLEDGDVVHLGETRVYPNVAYLHRQNRCAHAIARHLRLCSPQTGLHVR